MDGIREDSSGLDAVRTCNGGAKRVKPGWLPQYLPTKASSIANMIMAECVFKGTF